MPSRLLFFCLIFVFSAHAADELDVKTKLGDENQIAADEQSTSVDERVDSSTTEQVEEESDLDIEEVNPAMENVEVIGQTEEEADLDIDEIDPAMENAEVVGQTEEESDLDIDEIDPAMENVEVVGRIEEESDLDIEEVNPAMENVEVIGQTEEEADLDIEEVNPAMENVEVIGQRQDNVWDLPISTISIDGLSLQQRDIVDLTTLSERVLSFFHSESIVSSDRFFIRGLGTIGTNPGFDQAVGLALDGITFSRSRFGRTTFLDLESVVVYKGSVNEARSKNSPAGFLELNTADAQANTEGYVSTFLQFDSAPGLSTDVATNIPIDEDWSMRLASRVEVRAGWVENPSISSSGQQKQDWTVRGKWNALFSDDRKVEILYQYGALEREGRNRELQGCLATSAGDDCTIDRVRYGVSTRRGGAGMGIEFFNTRYHLFAVEQTTPRAEATSSHLFNLAAYTSDDYYDADQSLERLDASLISTQEEYYQFDFEYRYATRREHWFNYHFAFRFGGNVVNYDESTIFCGNRYDSRGVIVERADCADSLSPSFQGAQRNVDATHLEGSMLIYNQFDFQLSEQWRLEWSQRLSFIYKNIEGRAFLSQPWNREDGIINPENSDYVSCRDYVALQALLRFEGRNLVCHEPLAIHNLNYGFDKLFEPYLWQPTINLIWEHNSEKIYFRYNQSIKSFGYEIWPITQGIGFNIIDGLTPLFPEQYQFRAETSTITELGGSHSWFDDALDLHWAIWLTYIEDLQVSNYDTFLQHQFTTNVGLASSRGVEFNLGYFVAPQHQLNAELVYTLARYEEHTHAPCYENQTVEQGCFPLDQNTVFFSIADRAQSLSGADLEYAPRWQIRAGYSGSFFISEDWQTGLDVTWYYRSQYFIGTTHHPVYDVQGKIATIDLRWAFFTEEWELALLVRNLANAFTASFSSSDSAHDRVSILGEPSTRIYTAFSRPGREIAFHLKYLW